MEEERAEVHTQEGRGGEGSTRAWSDRNFARNRRGVTGAKAERRPGGLIDRGEIFWNILEEAVSGVQSAAECVAVRVVQAALQALVVGGGRGARGGNGEDVAAKEVHARD